VGQGLVDRGGQRLRRQAGLVGDLHAAAFGQQAGAQGLLGLALGGEGDQHGADPGHQNIHDRIVTSLADRQRGAAQDVTVVLAQGFHRNALCFNQFRPVFRRQVRAGYQAPWRLGHDGQGARRQRRGQQLATHRAAARRDDDLALARPLRRGIRRGGRDIAGIADQVGDIAGGGEGGAEWNQRLVAMDQHRVETVAQDGDDLLLAARLVLLDQDIAHRGGDRDAAGPRRPQQRYQLEPELPAPEREAFDQQNIRVCLTKGVEQGGAPAFPPGVVDVAAPRIHQPPEARVGGPDRRQLNKMGATEIRHAAGLAAGNACDLQAARPHGSDDRRGAHLVADTQQMLDIDHDARGAHRWSPPASGRFSRSTAGAPSADSMKI